jgi:hypothetical protein
METFIGNSALTLPLAVGQLRRPPTKLQKGKLFDECQIEVVRSAQGYVQALLDHLQALV